MARTLDHIVDDAAFEKHKVAQEERQSRKDVFFVWVLLVMIAVVGAHFTLNLSGGSMTGYVTAEQDPVENASLLLQASFVLFVTIMIVALIYTGVTKNDQD